MAKKKGRHQCVSDTDFARFAQLSDEENQTPEGEKLGTRVTTAIADCKHCSGRFEAVCDRVYQGILPSINSGEGWN